MSDETMVQRFERFVVDQCAKKGALYAAAPVSQLAADFAESEVRRALAPRSQSPELAKAEDAAWTSYLEFASRLPLHFQSEAGNVARVLVDAAVARVAGMFRRVMAESSAKAAGMRDEVERLRGALVRIGTGHCYGETPDVESCSQVLGVEDYCDRCIALHALGGSAPAQDRATRENLPTVEELAKFLEGHLRMRSLNMSFAQEARKHAEALLDWLPTITAERGKDPGET